MYSSDFITKLLVALAPKREINEVCGTTLELLRKEYDPVSAAIFWRISKEDRFKLESQFGLSVTFINRFILDGLESMAEKGLIPTQGVEKISIHHNINIKNLLRSDNTVKNPQYKLIILSLESDEELKGFLWLVFNEAEDISKERLNILEEIRRLLGVLIKKAQTYNELHKTVEQLEKLINVQNYMLIDLDIKSMLKRSMLEIKNIFKPDMVEVILCRDKTFEIFDQNEKSYVLDTKKPVFKLFKKTYDRLKEKCDFIIYDLSDPQIEEFKKYYKINSCLILPISIQKKVEGFFIIGKNESRFFRTEDIPLYSSIPSLISQALYIGNLHRDILNLQDHLFQAAKMESIGILAGGISHDFNNALAGLMSAADLIELTAGNDPKLKKYIHIIQKSSTRMANWTKQLLAYAKGGFYQIREINLNDIIIETLAIVHNSFSKKISLTISLDPDLSIINADPDGIKQVITNILMNSSESIKDKGHIKILTDNFRYDQKTYDENRLVENKSYTRIRIEDSGCGMSEETLSKIFEPFFTTKFQGRGLGLAAVYGILQRHKGKINFKSKIGAGTIANIYLPIDDTIDLPPVPKKELSERKYNILIISIFDVEQSSDYKILPLNGFNVTECYDIEMATELMLNKDINLVFIDSQYPELILEKLMPNIANLKSSTKILISDTELISESRLSMFINRSIKYINRPFNSVELLEIVNQLIKI